MKEYKKKMLNTREIKNQHTDFKMNYIKKMKEEQLEGELIKRQSRMKLRRKDKNNSASGKGSRSRREVSKPPMRSSRE